MSTDTTTPDTGNTVQQSNTSQASPQTPEQPAPAQAIPPQPQGTQQPAPESQAPQPVPATGETAAQPSPGGGPAQPAHKNPVKKLLVLFGVIAVLAIIIVGLLRYFTLSRNVVTKSESAVKKPAVKLAVNPWKASELNAAIAKILLEEKLGYTVTLVNIDEYSQWQSLADGDIHASLEVWPSGHMENLKRYVDTEKIVESLGALGVVGKIGWYVPKYLVTDHPELSTWEGFKTAKNSSLFAAAPGGKGQYLLGDATWTTYDEQIIKNLGLNMEVKVIGSEDETLKLVGEAYAQKKPVVFYLWTPHWAHAVYDLSEVQLPEYTDTCYAVKEKVNCDYPKDPLRKVAWSGLKEYAPDAYSFLKKFNYTNEDQIRMLAALQMEKQSTEEVARNWVRNNEAVWQLWLQ